MSAPGQSEARPITLGRYELIAPIGRGGMAEVHLAIQREPAGLEKLVVIKLVHEHLAAQPAFAQMLADEARHAGLIKHPNVVEIYELGSEAGRPFIVMEYLAGEPLLEVLRISGEGGARLDSFSIARVIANAAEGLDAAHQLEARDGRPLELVHHDVSPGNIVVLYSGLVKLVDFGVAKVQQAPSGARVHGKLGYMSPEKVQNAAVDRRSDVWSLGCVLWEALTLRRLFKGDTDADTVRQVLSASIAPPSRLVLSAAPELDTIVMRALQRDPNRRYPTAKAMAADLEAVLRGERYGAKNDRIARHMEAVFAPRIAARERVLMDISQKRRPSPETLDAAFGEVTTHAARTLTSPRRGPTAPPAPAAAAGAEAAHALATEKMPALARDTAGAPATEKMPALARDTAATPPADAHKAAAAAPPGTEPAVDFDEPRTETALTPMSPTPAIAAAALGPPPLRGERGISPSAFSQPRTRQTGKTLPPRVFSVASLLDTREEADEPIRPDDPLLARLPNAPAPSAPSAPRASGPRVTPSGPIPAASRAAPPAPPTPPPTASRATPPGPIPAVSRATPPGPIPAVSRATPPEPIPAISRATPPAPPAPPTAASRATPPAPPAAASRATPPAPSPTAPPPHGEATSATPPGSAAPPRRDEPNPFAEDDELKTVADVIPANAEASRSLQSEPSWTVARQSAALGELQRWVQETRSPPKSRWDAVVRKVRPWHQRVVAWSYKRRVPPWSPYAAASVVLLLLVLLVGPCTGDSSDAKPSKPAAGAAPAQGEIESDTDVARPPKQR